MLSILIPIYNFNVINLTQTLIAQSEKLKICFEIICYDDGSYNNFKDVNKLLLNQENITYKEFKKNVGRSKIRNLLAKKAKYDYLLFLDCDSGIIKSDFVEKYLKNKHKADVIYGGRIHNPKPPKEKRLLLRWKYGIKREDQTYKKRGKKPYIHFKTNNYLIKKNIALKNKFDIQIKGYGHEDTLLGLDLKRKGVEILHINNPVMHLELDDAATFLKKTEQGLENLLFLINKNILNSKIKLYPYYIILKKVEPLLSTLIKVIKDHCKKRLLKGKSSMILFNLYKLTYLVSLKKK